MSALLGGCYQVCPPYDGASTQATPSEQDSDVGPRSDDTAYTYGEVWTVPRTAEHDAGSTSSVPGSNTPWTAVVYTQSTFVLSEDEPLQGKLTLRLDRNGTVSASLPIVGATASAQPSASAFATAGEKGTGWLQRFSGRGDLSCASVSPESKRETDVNDLLGVQFMLARTPKSAGELAVFGVQVRGSGRDFSHSQIVNGTEKTFSAEFGDTAAGTKTFAAGLRVFRISITAQRVDGHVILPSSEGQLIDAKFNPQRHMLYTVNLGFVLQNHHGSLPAPRTGALRVHYTAP